MQFSISDSMVSEFLSGLSAIFALVAVGGILSLILGGMARRFPFTRLALVLALAPFSLMRFLDRSGSSTLFLYSMIVILLGITIDGISFVLEPKSAAQPTTEAETSEEAENDDELDPGMIVWEKAE